jgi:type I site-specific restriction endonuclease
LGELLANGKSMDKKQLSERDICTKYINITPALERSGWDVLTQVREEFPLTIGRILVRGKLHARADYVLFYKPNIPLAVIEAKDNKHSLGDGMQQELGYAAMLQVPFVFSSNGDGFLFHNKIATDGIIGGGAKRKGRKKTEYGWKVSVQDLEGRNYNLDCKNLHEIEVNYRDPDDLMMEYLEIDRQMQDAQNSLKQELIRALGGK